LACKSKFYNSIIIRDADFLKEEYSKKSLGIILYTLENPKDTLISELLNKSISKGFPYAYAYISNNNYILFSKFLSRLIKKSGGIDNLTDTEINSNLLILLVFALSSGKEIEVKDKLYIEFLNTLELMSEHGKVEGTCRISLDNMPEEESIKLKKYKEYFIQHYGLISNISDTHRFKNEKSYKIVEFLFDYEKISTSLFDNITLSKNDIDEIFHLVSLFNPNIENILDDVLYCYYLKNILKSYSYMKDYYFRNNKETLYFQFEELESQTKDLSASIKSKDSTIQELQSQIQSLEKHNKILNSKIDKSKIYEEELYSLREMMFNLDNQEEYIPEDEIDISKLENIKLLIIGGHDKWQQRMKETLKNTIFISPNNLNFDISLINNVEMVYVYTQYINHSIYYKAVEGCKKYNKKIKYINVSNEDIVFKCILELI
jgi:hypothetical protein